MSSFNLRMFPSARCKALYQIVFPPVSQFRKRSTGLVSAFVRPRKSGTPWRTRGVIQAVHARKREHTSQRYYSGLSVNSGDRGGGCTVEVVNGGREVRVVWPGEEGQQNTYHATWLKHSCQCPLCWDKDALQCVAWEWDPDPRGIMVTEAKVKGPVETGDLELTWNFAGEGEQHTGSIPLKWLQENCYSHEALKRRREAATPILATSLPVMNFINIKQDERQLWKWLKLMNVYGLCLLRNVPTKPGSVIEVATLAGGLLKTHYGDMFDVIAEETPANVAFTDVYLPFHNDLTYYESPPGLQFLHCLRNDDTVEGGESVLLDMWAVVEQFRKEHPTNFNVLSTVGITRQRVHYSRTNPVHIKRKRPHFVLDNDGELAAVYWNRYHEGPPLIPPEQMEGYFEAVHSFTVFIKNSPYKLKHRLQPGEALTFNNRRMQHGRTHFVQHGGQRHLQGVYVGIDYFMSKVNILASKYEPQFSPKNSFGLDTM